MSAEPYEVTNFDRKLVAARTRPECTWRQGLFKASRDDRLKLFDHYYRIADSIERLPGGLSPARESVRNDLFRFAWHMNDIVVDYHSRLRKRVSYRYPAYGREIARRRQDGKVPAPREGVHVFVVMRFHHIAAARGAACVVVEPAANFDRYDYRFMNGLDVQILTAKCDLNFSVWLARVIAADGAMSVTMRRLDAPRIPVETLFDGRRTWPY